MKLNVGIPNLSGTTNINDLIVPEVLRHRKKTGVEWFDQAIGGDGLVPSSVTMLTGTPGAGKTTMMLQLADSITAQGHLCLYNSGEESLYQVKMVTERIGLKHGFYVGQDVMCADLLKHAEALKKLHPLKQLFVLQDSLQTLDDGFYKNGGTNSMTPVRATEMITGWAKDTMGILIFIGQVTKGGEFAGKNTILHAVDVRAQLFIDQDKSSETRGERIFRVTKNRFGVSGTAFIMGMRKEGLYEKGSYNFCNDVD